MDVQLYVYDLSKGLARQLSGQFLGTQIDAVYHTSLVFGGIEYFFGAGVQTSYPGSTHHGRPMEVLAMGTTQLEIEIILEYLDSLKTIYTAESYDLFMHNCNNFCNDFAMFLVGRGIPDHITSLPQTVLNTPYGQMLKPQLDSAMRGITQAPVAQSARPPVASSSLTPNSHNGGLSRPPNETSKGQSPHALGKVHNVTRLSELDSLLAAANSSCAAIFFTSITCPPCKICYPTYDSLAAEFPTQVTLIKVDISQSSEIGAKYAIRATPTFMTFLHGSKLDEWKGADPAALTGNVRLLVQMAHPPHPHSQLRLPTLQRPQQKPVTYAKIPPVEKLLAKLGPDASNPAVKALTQFVQTRFSSAPAANAALPDLRSISSFICASLEKVAVPELFALIDLFRLALVDPRVSGYFAEEDVPSSLVLNLLRKVNELDGSCPYSLRIVTLQAACNLFSTTLYPPKLLGNRMLCSPLISMVATSLLDEGHAHVRISAASLAFNISSWNHRLRLERQEDVLDEASQVELAASLIEAIDRETSSDALKGLVLALGLLAYECPIGGELKELLAAMAAGEVVQGKKLAGSQALIGEVVEVVAA